MSKPKHTPGPWHVGVKPKGKKFYVGHAYDGAVAVVETAKDAALVSAAPDLLEQLKRVAREMGLDPEEGNSGFRRLSRDVLAAIAKAEGRS